MKIKHRILLIILLANLYGIYGCAGFWLSRNSAVAVKDLPKTDIEYFDITEARRNHPVNGSQIYNDKREWCGLTVWAGIPIPLWLPVCHSYTKVTFADGQPIKRVDQHLEGGGFLCGPFVYMIMSSLCSDKFY